MFENFRENIDVDGLKVAVVNLGCAKNLVDGEVIISSLIDSGIELCENVEDADIVIVNTCGFIQSASLESINTLLELSKSKKVIAIGCLVERYKDELVKSMPEVDVFFGTDSANSLLKLFKKPQIELKRRIHTTGVYTYLKISEGCNRLCSFCVIPKIRGRHRSRVIDDILSEAKILLSRGARELCIVSQDTGYYGKDLHDGTNLLKLLSELEKLDGRFWVRLFYLYPTDLNKELIEFIRDSEKVIPYFDIPLQHISDNILKSMRRGYSKKEIYNLLELIYKSIPNAIIRTTFIVGYPSETDGDFKELIDFVSEGHIHWLGAFAYSPEEGTNAFELGDRLSRKEKNARLRAIYETQKSITLKKNRALVGSKLEVLVEGFEGPILYGRSKLNAPEVDGAIYIQSERELKPGDFILAKVAGAKEYDLKVVF
ncbi:MAG: 30S ribosomal protein S12 methylthiotransferase RimO [Aquificaceae bacterium]|nr:30S ribosomal protein S12 methylthiotransferase RimO [Aquificaceae bacterium]